MFRHVDHEQLAGAEVSATDVPLDLVLASAAMAERCTASYVDIEPRRQERPSDHAPAVAEFNL